MELCQFLCLVGDGGRPFSVPRVEHISIDEGNPANKDVFFGNYESSPLEGEDQCKHSCSLTFADKRPHSG